MSSKPKHAQKKKHGCLITLVVFLLILIVGIVGAVFYVKQAPARISQRTPEPVITASPAPTEALTENSSETNTAGQPSPDQQATKNPEITATPAPTAEPFDWSVNTSLPDDEWINILLMGSDASDPELPGRTDTMIIASVNMIDGRLKLTSIMRDTYVPIAGHAKNKITSANWFGGVDLALKTVNEAFDMNITHYAMVDFSSFAYLVEELGGVDMPVSEVEMKYMNQLMEDMRVLYPEIELEKNDLMEFGESVHLDGMQTLAYSRIRKLDSDFQRTGRQRMVLSAILQKLRTVRDPGTLYSLFDIGLEYTRTSLTAGDIAILAMKVLTNGMDFEEMRLPVDGTYTYATYNEQEVLDPDLDKNAALLHEFIYGAEIAQ